MDGSGRAETHASDIHGVPAPFELALLDADGVIVAVNEAWLNFAAANGAQGAFTGVGASYLDVCDQAVDAPGAKEVGDAIRAVLRGRTPSVYRVTIPCHSPSEVRWFDIYVTERVDDEGRPHGATVMLTPVSRASVVTRDDRAALDRKAMAERRGEICGDLHAAIVRDLFGSALALVAVRRLLSAAVAAEVDAVIDQLDSIVRAIQVAEHSIHRSRT